MIWQQQLFPRLRPLCSYLNFYRGFGSFQRECLSSKWINGSKTSVGFPKRHSVLNTNHPLSSLMRSGAPPCNQVRSYIVVPTVLEQSTLKTIVGLTNRLDTRLSMPMVNTHPSQALTQVRSVVKYSKLGKRKTVKAVAKRFHRTGSGKLKYWPSGKVHNMLAKSRNKRRDLRKPRYANKTRLKILNKMISGW